jgi:hypothetical protein
MQRHKWRLQQTCLITKSAMKRQQENL